ncbi:transglutaminase family protein [Waddlia chondrophila]|uniref:Protein SirB1 N-terminal domain-containing protein n=1 Tax=Waddlia chondrophila (strain ATCC VR-1470 / WSU 86-1044) TaxID=716544 RepID=D6YVP8_WADCW|nr:transglutaminase family protein [Waddlia chondrophila]ADI38209.1 conserved hypothetical protein [Waddlia chondrophila WSU 86-1044]
MPRLLIFLIFIYCTALSGANIRTLYNSLDPLSIPQHLAFYENYPDTPEGRQSLEHAWNLLSGGKEITQPGSLSMISSEALNSIIHLVNKPVNENTQLLSDTERSLIDSLARHLPNRRLKGYDAKTEEEVIALPNEEIDLAHGLFLTQLGADQWDEIRSYEAMIDLMALQLLTKISLQTPPEDKIRAISTLIFDEMGFRFPPHSIYAKDIDHYTFLPSVLDSRQGVCLGVSILYLSLAQRIGLELEVITPPGHIYVRWKGDSKVRNIETTARGIHIDSEEYLGIETKELEIRPLKEVIGMAHINQASIYLHNQQFEKALASYQKAQPYLAEHAQLKELLGFTYLFTGDKVRGTTLLKSVQGHIPSHATTSNTLVEDYLEGAVDEEGIQTLFLRVDEDRTSILNKKTALEKILIKHPNFRDGWKALAITWLQLHRSKEALQHLKTYHKLYSEDPSVEYYLAVIYTQRLEYENAWKHLNVSLELLKPFDHNPKALKELRRHLSLLYPLRRNT